MSKKLVIACRIKDRAESTKQTSIHIDNQILSWLEANSTGNKQVAFNYIMQIGIQAIEKEPGAVIVEELINLQS